MSLIKNAAPEVIMLGADDKSTRVVTPEREPIPQHLPLCFFFAKKGTNKRVLAGANKLVQQYGAQTFEINDIYFNHSTRFMVAMGSTGNTLMTQRLIPTDAGVRANANIYMDVLETTIPKYARNSKGDLVVDPNTNEYKVEVDADGKELTVDGFKIKFIKEVATTESKTGLLTTKNGTMSDTNGNVSTMYPIFEVKAKYQGEYYNNIGFILRSLFKGEQDDKIISKTKSLSYNLELVTRDNPKSSHQTFRNLFGEPSTQFSLAEKAINPNTESRFDLEYVFDSMWFNETDNLKPLKYADYESFYFYRENYEELCKRFLAAEKQFVTSDELTWDDGIDSSTDKWYDFTTTDATEIDAEFGLINPFVCKSSKNVKYRTLVHDEAGANTTGTQREINLSSETPIFLDGGSDGSLTNEMFESLVKIELDKYLDTDSEVMDTAINVESIIHDSGFTLECKKSLVNFITERKDTMVVLSTHDASLGEEDLPLSEARAVGVALKTRLKLAPESTYFGTPVARAVIVAGTGLLRDGSTKNRIPLGYEIAYKMAKMMGAGNYMWKMTELFDNYPGNSITQLIDVNPGFIPAGIKPTLWNDGLVWAQPYDRNTYHFPAIQTVYDNDTSVLNSIFTVAALCTITKIGADAWRNFTGTTGMTNEAFKAAVANYVNNRTKDIFGTMMVVVPEVLITDEDELRGYSWRLITKLYANNMKTKMVHSSEIYRMSDLAEQN